MKDIVAGKTPGRNSPSDITLFDTIGVGAEDVALATYVLKRARALNVGVDLPIEPPVREHARWRRPPRRHRTPRLDQHPTPYRKVATNDRHRHARSHLGARPRLGALPRAGGHGARLQAVAAQPHGRRDTRQPEGATRASRRRLAPTCSSSSDGPGRCPTRSGASPPSCTSRSRSTTCSRAASTCSRTVSPAW